MASLRIFLTVCLAVLLHACGGGGGGGGGSPAPTPTPTPTVAVALSTSTPTIQASQTAQFQATVTGTSNTQVTYAVDGGNTNGSITASGLYTAPNRAGVFTVRATSVADPAQSATATITVTAPPAANVFRLSGNVRIAPGTTTQFTAFLDEQPVAAQWAIVSACTGCSINGNGLFTAGSTVQSATVRGALATNPAQTATAIVTIATEVILTLDAAAGPSLSAADMLTFNAFISPDGIEPGLSFATGPGTNAGSVINVDYFFGWVPPSTPGAYTVTIASLADPSKTAAFGVQVTAPPATALAPTAGAPSAMRYEHAAATMADGRIVLVGGQRDRQAFVHALAAEVFNPQTGTFGSGPALALGRVRPEAIAIDADRVLVTGGQEEWNLAHATAEILNLASNTAAATGNAMNARRIHHGMARLTTGPSSGKVLVMGGFNGPVPYGVPTWLATNTVDLFDPATNLFAASGATLVTARGLFTTTVLADGRVLLVGGYAPSPGAGALASAEIYDPVAGTFSATGSMATARYGHTATRLPDGKVLIVGGDPDAAGRSTAEIYDPASGTFSAVASLLAVARIHHAAAALGDGRVLVFGGDSGNYLVRGTVEVFDPATRTFSLYASMAIARTRATASTLSTGPNAGRVLVFGGGARNTPQLAAELTPPGPGGAYY